VLLAAYAVGFSILHVALNLTGAYILHPWVDIPMHVGGGIWVAWAALVFGERIASVRALPVLIKVVGVLGAVALVGVLWELWEAVGDTSLILSGGVPLAGVAEAFGFAPFNNRWDTLLDLFNDLAGGVLVLAVWLLTRGREGR
jgi:hypothetical protein